jgi:hypothetical protein
MKSALAFQVFIIFWAISTAFATDYYISPSGNDANSGTSPAESWQTIAKVNSTDFEPGDSIFFEGGETFTGGIQFSDEDMGTPNSPVIVSSYGTGMATISSGTQNGLYAHNCAGFEVRDLIFVGAGREVAADFSGVYFYTNTNSGEKLEYIRIDNLDVSGYREKGIAIGGYHSSNSGFKDVRITNCVVHDNGCIGIESYGWWPSDPCDRSHRDIYVGDCTVYNNAGIPGREPHSGNGIVISGVDGAVIEFCEAYNNGWLCDAPGGGPLGIWTWEADNLIIQFCESHHNKTSGGDGGGFDIDGGCKNCIMQYNYSHDNEGCGYLICQFSGASEYKNNICRYNITEGDATGSRSAMGAITYWSSGSAGGIQNTEFYGNTIYVSSATRGGGINIWSGTIYNTGTYNNIIMTVPGERDVNATNTSGGWDFKGNCYWSSGSPIEIYWGGTTYYSLADWQSATGQEMLDGSPVGFECDPQLINAGGGGTIGDPRLLYALDAYKLQDTSPLIDTGVDIQAEFGINPGPIDYYSTSIPQNGSYDVGAYEYRYPADFDDNGKVDFCDYARLAEGWQSQFADEQFEVIYDLEPDKIIDIFDFSAFCDSWLWGQ